MPVTLSRDDMALLTEGVSMPARSINMSPYGGSTPKNWTKSKGPAAGRPVCPFALCKLL
jgi:hypothetical protein